jgi:hypothetical protein
MDKINFILDNMPDHYNKETNSNLYKILSAISKELDTFVSYANEVKNSKFVDFAKKSDLDKIGKLLNLKRFINEDDTNFRSRIKSKVPSFVGGGTISSIKQVVTNYLGVEPVIIEHYKPGEGHVSFDNGILNGFTIEIISGLNIQIKAGTGYINGIRITSNDTAKLLSSNSTTYIKLNSNGIFSYETTSTLTTTQVMIGKIITTSIITSILDMRNILNPEEHYITNTASITVQIPFNFSISNISVEDVKDILRNTKAAGIALLIKIMETYNDYIEITDNANTYFLMGFSGIGGNNILGGI